MTPRVTSVTTRTSSGTPRAAHLVKVRVRARVRVRVRVRMTLNLALSLTARRTPAAKVLRLRATLWPVRVVHVQRMHLVVPRQP